jgi:hypothetical protein
MARTPLSKLDKYPEIPVEHITYEFFQTPPAPILSLLNATPTPIQWSTAKVLDVGAGRGSIGRTIKEQMGSTVDSIEIRDEEKDILALHSDNVWITDFMNWTPPEGYTPSLIISNPPFSKAVDVAMHTFNLFPQVPLVMLQRLEWLGSKKRMGFFNTHPVEALWTLSQRPSFLGSSRKIDIWSYSWFGWNMPMQCHGIRSI